MTPDQLAFASGQSASQAPDVSVTMYTTTWCSDCTAAKRYLDAKGVTYVEVDIENDEVAAQLVMSINGGKRSVPTLVAANTAASLSNFSVAKGRQFLEDAGLID